MIYNNEVSILLFLDLSSAFYILGHDILINRLHDYADVDRIALQWFSSYLQGRTEKVKICNVYSSLFHLFWGVPYGSVLGPMLFSIYTAPLSAIMDLYGVLYRIYADDTQLYLSFKIGNLNQSRIKVKSGCQIIC